jgi:hypothetical protein
MFTLPSSRAGSLGDPPGRVDWKSRSTAATVSNVSVRACLFPSQLTYVCKICNEWDEEHKTSDYRCREAFVQDDVSVHL